MIWLQIFVMVCVKLPIITFTEWCKSNFYCLYLLITRARKSLLRHRYQSSTFIRTQSWVTCTFPPPEHSWVCASNSGSCRAGAFATDSSICTSRPFSSSCNGVAVGHSSASTQMVHVLCISRKYRRALTALAPYVFLQLLRSEINIPLFSPCWLSTR